MNLTEFKLDENYIITRLYVSRKTLLGIKWVI